MRPRVLITGASGFSGRHLVAWCAQEGHRVYALFDRQAGEWKGTPRVTAVRCNVAHAPAIQRAVRQIRPTHIVHLATRTSQRADPETLADDLRLTWQVALAALAHARRARVLLVSSCAVYGRGSRLRPVSERWPVRPVSAYGRMKQAQEAIGTYVTARWGLPVYVARPFNLVGPGQPRGFVAADLIAQSPAPMPLTLPRSAAATIRDFLDVRDAVRAYWHILCSGQPGRPYNVCSGRPCSLRQLGQQLAVLSGRALQWRAAAPNRSLRSASVQAIFGSAARLRRETGWRPRIALAQALIAQYAAEVS